MPVTELLFSGDTTEQGRVIINNAYSQDCIWTGSTGDFTGITKNIITNNDGNNIVSGDSSTNSSFVNYSSILSGVDNEIRTLNPNNTNINNSSIVSGDNNLIAQSAASADIENCVIIGSKDSAITGTSNISNTVILAGNALTGSSSNVVYTQRIHSFGARIRNLSSYSIVNADWTPNLSGLSPKYLGSNDEYVVLYNNVSSLPGLGEYNFGVGSLLSSDVGRVVDILALYFFGGTQSIKIGIGALIFGSDIVVNGASLTAGPISICATDYTSVRLVVKEKIGNITYVEMYGTGA